MCDEHGDRITGLNLGESVGDIAAISVGGGMTKWPGSCVFSAGGGGFTSYFYHSHARLVACCMAVNATGITWISSSEVWCTISPVACKSAEKGGGSDFFRGSALCAHTTFALVSDLVRPPPLVVSVWSQRRGV